MTHREPGCETHSRWLSHNSITTTSCDYIIVIWLQSLHNTSRQMGFPTESYLCLMSMSSSSYTMRFRVG
jgi:hypothetical protein